MPSRKEHEEFEKKFLGRSYPSVHKAKDSMAPAYQEKHRKFFHDLKTDIALAVLFKDPRAGVSAFLHDVLDFSEG